ncbi:hypothetical protein ACFLRU_00370 [Bacteroidota bacterium]
MKQFIKSLAIVVATVAILAISLASCNSDINNEEAFEEAALKSYTLSRAEDGSYSLEQTLASGEVTSTIVPLVNNEIKIDFETESSVKIPGLTIFDEPVSSVKGVSYKTRVDLKSYAISKLENGSYDISFKVANFIVPSFSYNEEYDRYEIRLTEGDNNGITDYTENYVKFEREKIKVVFIHVSTRTTLARDIFQETVGPPELYF